MKTYRILRWVRIALALCVWGLLTFFFVFGASGSFPLWQQLLKIQFVPAVLSITTGSLAVVLALLIVTLLFGRLYCSVICPLGIYQDIVIWIASLFKTKKQRRFSYQPAKTAIRYGILLAVAICVIFGLILPLVFIDPYGLYGKMAVNLSFSHDFVWISFAFSLCVWIVITLLAAFKGRFYCNVICPVGTLLGTISKYSMFRLTVDTTKCKHCLLCGLSCKSQCLDSKNVKIDHSRCVGCLDCTKACTENALHYAFAWKKTTPAQVISAEAKGTPKLVKTDAAQGHKTGRRAFLLGCIGVGAGAVLYNRFAVKEPKRINAGMPPGAGTLARFKDRCVGCYACVAACPAHIIAPSVTELGTQGFLLPSLSYKNGFCGYECQRCQEVCPAGAIQKMSLDEKKRVKIGVAKFTLENCIIKKDGTDCGACDEHCPVKAVSITPTIDFKIVGGISVQVEAFYPKVKPNLCIGCGGCEYICPATPKAIQVVPMALQNIADIPEQTVQEQKTDVDFGF